MLSVLQVRRLREKGKYGDGQGLILHVVTKQRRNWVFRYTRNGQERTMGLGSANDVSLGEARDKAQAARKLLTAGIDPIDHRRAECEAELARKAARTPFAEVAALYVAAHEAAWRSDKHRQQWRNTLTAYTNPIIGKVPVGDIDTNLVLSVLQPVWNLRPETASRVRSRIENVLDYAIARGWRSGPNPATWRGNLKSMLPSRSKLRAVKHHVALDWHEAPAFMAELRKRRGIGPRALEFTILTAGRSGEVRGATWDEIDLEHAIWQIPAERMKTGGKPHRVPLSKPALALLRAMQPLGSSQHSLVFPGHVSQRPLAGVSLTRPMESMGGGKLTAHGFRSTFRDWAAEATNYPNHVVEQALAHTIGSAVERAYRHGDLFARRAALMDDWAAFLERPAAEVVQLRPGQRR